MASVNRFGSELGLIHEVTILGRKVGADRGFWKTLSQDEEVFRKVVEMVKSTPLSKAPRPQLTETETYKVTVAYGLSLETMIHSGEFDRVNGDIIPEHFPHNASDPEEIEICIVSLGSDATTDEVLAEFDRMDMRPATLAELLALDTTYPDLQPKFWMVSLGSGWWDPDGSVYFPFLCGSFGYRILDLYWNSPQSRWNAGYRFAAVRK